MEYNRLEFPQPPPQYMPTAPIIQPPMAPMVLQPNFVQQPSIHIVPVPQVITQQPSKSSTFSLSIYSRKNQNMKDYIYDLISFINHSSCGACASQFYAWISSGDDHLFELWGTVVYQIKIQSLRKNSFDITVNVYPWVYYIRILTDSVSLV